MLGAGRHVGVGGMPAYREYLLGSQGQILARSETECDDDVAALEHARKNVLLHPIEVWQGDRLVGTVHPGDKPKPPN
jgi:hypothetical protein